MIRDLKTIHAEARKVFAKRDKLEAELRALNNQINQLKAEHMVITRVWGLREESFRQETTKVAA
jgi:uncharacterized coiled-coil DUF342 family protein